MDKQTLDAFRERRSDAYWAWVNGDEAGGLLWEAHSLWLDSRDPVPVKMWLWDAYVDAKRMHELAQDTYDAAQRQEQDHGHRNS